MRYLFDHAAHIVAQYDGALPLAAWLKQYTKQHPRLGSRDRRMLADMVYAWYRCAKGFDADRPFEEKLVACLAACKLENTLQRLLSKDVQPGPHPAPVVESLLPQGFPDLSKGIVLGDWLRSMLRQPRAFLRIRPGFEQAAKRALAQSGTEHDWLTGDCVALPPGRDAAAVLDARWYVVQDASSQQTGAWLRPKAGEDWWDCCAGAGGKTLLLLDQEPAVRLLATDIRPAIMHNLRKRVGPYGLPMPGTLVVNTTDERALAAALGKHRFDAILCDAPCTGSGTWARTPEQLYFFQPEVVRDYTARQLQILWGVSRYLKPGGRIVYITCSVFAAENEAVVAAFCGESNFALEEDALINGLGEGADSMYVARLVNR